jgi:hypothetical protein
VTCLNLLMFFRPSIRKQCNFGFRPFDLHLCIREVRIFHYLKIWVVELRY